MTSGATYSAYQIVVVPFPFTERPVSKRRPALVLSSDDFNRTHDQLLLAMITSSSDPWLSDVAIKGWRKAGLAGRCHVRFKLFTLPKSMVLDSVGVLGGPDRLVVARQVSKIFP